MTDYRFKNRRKMAWIAFYFMLTVGAIMLLLGITQEDVAERIEKMAFLLGSIFGMCTTIVISYFSSSTVTQMNDTKFERVEPPLEGK